MMDARKPIDPKRKERYAELVGLGLSHPEAAGATGISERSGERLMAEPGYRKIAAEARRGRGLQGEVAQVVRDLLAAVQADGVTPDLRLRQKGVEAYLKNPALLDAEDEEELLPDGVVLVYPRSPDDQDKRGPGLQGWLPEGTTVHYPDGRRALVRPARDTRGNVSSAHFQLEDLEPEH
jgi:hypothetical protein